MRPLASHNYFVYITTNKNRTVLYIGVTNDLRIRLSQHRVESRGAKKTFAGKYNAYFLIYWERFEFAEHAIEREKEMKKWRRSKKEALINQFNPDWNFINEEVD